MIAVRDINSDLATGLLVGYILALVPLAILYYDYLISLSDEVKYFWLWRTNEPNRDVSIRPLPGSLHKQRRLPWQRPDWISCLCLVNRYVSTIGHIPIMKSYLVMGDLAYCHRLYGYHQFFEMILQILVAVLCIVRTYSLYGEEHHMSMGLAKKPWNERTRHIFNFRRPVSGRRIVLVLLCSIVFISVLSGSVRAFALTHTSASGPASAYPSCVGPDDNRKGHTKGPGGISDLSGMQRPAFPSRGARRIVLAWGGALVLDTAVFFLTVLRAIQSRRDAGPGASIREMAFLQVMVRNGTLYFATLFLVNLANILMLLFAPPLLKDSVTTMTNVLSTTLISRVMLHTRAKHAKTCKERRRKMVMLASPELADWDNVRDDRQQRSQEDAFGIEYIDLQPIPRQN